MQLWEQIVLGAAALLLVLVLWPGVQAAMARSREAQHRDWAAALVPVILVVIFVVLLVIIAKT